MLLLRGQNFENTPYYRKIYASDDLKMVILVDEYGNIHELHLSWGRDEIIDVKYGQDYFDQDIFSRISLLNKIYPVVHDVRFQGSIKENQDRWINEIAISQDSIGNDDEDRSSMDSLRTGAAYMLNIILNNSEITIKDISSMNRILLREATSTNTKLFSGVPRGGSSLIDIGDKLVLARLDNNEMNMGGNLYLMRAKNVPSSLDLLITKINQVNTSSSVLSIVSLFRHFLIIHPFANANGRTGRLLLNFMLIKSGRPPLLSKASELRDIIFTPIEIYSRILSKYLYKQTE